MRWIVFIASLSIVFACSKQSESEAVLPAAEDYFPLDSGNFWIYDATFIHIDAAVNTFDTSEVELKMIYRKFDDSLQQHILERYTRVDSNDVWNEYDVITISWDELTMQWVENNLRYVKLTDPVYDNKSWDGNAFNILDDWNYYYSDINTVADVGDLTFSSTIRVEKRDVSNVIQKMRAYEIFAKNIGSVYDYNADFTFQSGSVSIGDSRELKLIKYGKE